MTSRLTEIRIVGKNKHRKTLCLYSCECGNKKVIVRSAVKNGNTKSCGCLYSKPRTHGMSSSPEYRTYKSMKARCYNHNNKEYNNYGKRGIIVCDRWLESFENFYADIGEKPTAKHSIERINVNDGYNPNNCKWIPVSEQPRNKRNNIIYNGELATHASIRLGGSCGLVALRLRVGWEIERAFTTQARPIKRKKA